MLQHALQLHEDGCVVVPVGHAKAPLVRWKHWSYRPQTRQHVYDLWNRHPEANVAIVLGAPSQLIVLDVERHAVDRGVLDGVLIPMTPVARSRSGGLHFYFQYDAAIRTMAWSLLDMHVGELRSDGALITAPPSTGYTWLRSPMEYELNEPPFHLVQQIRDDSALRQFVETRPPGELIDPGAAAAIDEPRASRSERDFALAQHLLLRGAPEADVVKAVLAEEKASALSAREAKRYAGLTVRNAARALADCAATVEVFAIDRRKEGVRLHVVVLDGIAQGRRLVADASVSGRSAAQRLWHSMQAAGIAARDVRSGMQLRARLRETAGTTYVNALVPLWNPPSGATVPRRAR